MALAVKDEIKKKAPRRKRGKVPSQGVAQPAGNPGGGERSTSPAGVPIWTDPWTELWRVLTAMYYTACHGLPDVERATWIQAGGHAFAERAADALKARCVEVMGPPPVTSLSERIGQNCPLHFDSKALCDCPTMADWLGEDLPERGT